MSRFASFAVSALVALVLAGAAFGAEGGFEIARATWTEIGLVLSGSAVLVVAILRSRRRRLDGGVTLLAFAALAALCGLSIIWSVAPDLSWGETSLTIAYLASFAGAVALARLLPDGWIAILRGVLLAAAAVVLYGLASRVWPAQLAADDVFARLGEPYSYWNALGATAALAVPPALWLGTRRAGYPPANALAYPLISLLTMAIFLSYSRAAIIVAGIGVLVWLAFVPLRLRTLTLLAVSLAGAAPVIVWALSRDAFTKNNATTPLRESVAPEFGLFIVATTLVVLTAGLVVGFRVARRPPRALARLRMGTVAGLVAVAVPALLCIVLANSDRGLGGTIKSGVESFTAVNKHTPGGPSRLLTASSSRGRYWHQARQIFGANQLKGSGADTFGIARLRYRDATDQSVSQHAHGFVQQTMADLGTLGLIVIGLLLLSATVAALRAIGVRRRRRLRPVGFGPERVGLFALALSALVYGLHSAVDWIWFVPGPTVMALAAAGFLAGRGPLVLRAGAAAATAPAALRAPAAGEGSPPPPPPPPPAPVREPAAAAVVGAPAAAVATRRESSSPPPPPPAPPSDGGGPNGNGSGGDEERTAVLDRLRVSRPGPPDPGGLRGRAARAIRPALALVTIAAALVSAWAIWQPLRSDRESDHALDLTAAGHYQAALAATRHARDYDPLTPRPLLVRAAVDDAGGHPQTALRDLQTAVAAFPADPETWLSLAQYQLSTLNEPAAALGTIKGALFLDPQSRSAQTVFFEASYRLHGGVAPAAPPVPGTPAVPATPGSPPPTTLPGTPGSPSAPRTVPGNPALPPGD